MQEQYPRRELNFPKGIPNSAIGVFAGTPGIGILATLNRNNTLPSPETLIYDMYVMAALTKPIAKAMELLRKVPELTYSLLPLEEIPATKRNYNIEVKQELGKPDQIELIPKTANNEPISLNYLLPEGYRFQNGDEFVCDNQNKIVKLPYNSFKFRVGIFGALHEIAHAIKVLPTEAEDERFASLFAVQAIRNLQNMGFDTFADFEKKSDIFKIVKHGLYSHEAKRKLRLYSHGLNTDSSVFTKKRLSTENKNPLAHIWHLMNVFSGIAALPTSYEAEQGYKKLPSNFPTLDF
ncbi:hypothetical protein A2954_06770 [Candidatus Roizmanbacteria bacterium RIFCSPLOWO2_01_FULL_37_12]|uniref:Uncharacterized protein n=1 Tax=Candidatus Roizmanbacteria bacterium RIFCSPLOWO2_01_FULL_37_12 TaxID=1802056 RepID=A0A1F7ID60_9BACT|nr:MAG: hypothetical protein A3D76_00175 [Candidatus Roizmanbacteria bacterium RIFCSPHIGHO2_02_FULL_37_9b]OGK41295.1 MAG: hypothetical protein A2954_06770 [Candidatus Roizmanbacteria bacterium RIFCSPLOWO2_01_FULL_37_12]